MKRKKKGNLGDAVLGLIFFSFVFIVLKDHPLIKIIIPIFILFAIFFVIVIIGKLITRFPGNSEFPSKTTKWIKSDPLIREKNTNENKETADLPPVWEPEYKTASQHDSVNKWSLELLRKLEWKRFEEVTAEYYRLQGFDAKTTQVGADGGIDIVLRKQGLDKPMAVVQCKAWNSNIGVKEIRALFGIMAAEKVDNGVFITTSNYSDDARKFAESKQILLLAGQELLDRILALDADKQKRLLEYATEGDYTTPTCPRCDIKMIKKIRKKDGGKFWGCRNFKPYGRGCSNIINIKVS